MAINLVGSAAWEAFVADLGEPILAQAAADGFTGQAGRVLLIREANGAPSRVFFGLGADAATGPMAIRDLPAKLPPGDYRFAGSLAGLDPGQVALAWSLGTYRFDRYKQDRGETAPRLAPPAGADMTEAHALAHAYALCRDMINTPANDMGPRQIETIAREIAEANQATIAVTVGDALTPAGYPAVHAVGRAAVAERAPRMIEMTWGEADHPLVALIGKGVVFDSGGLDIKPSAGMRLMKKDMGGAAHALALARMIMAARLPVRLHVLIPAVENAISGDAMRPGDVLSSRSGLTIEVGNTDAEGRLILADALTRAAELAPALTIDLATLTGAARVALGPRVVPFYTADDALAAELAAASRAVDDPLWRMPLWAGYAGALDSDIADI
ncbi:MAG: leucyl aminopeptidase family protein, partial [Caulobacteraceae bacterium]